MLTHAPRQAYVWLIFDVGQNNMTFLQSGLLSLASTLLAILSLGGFIIFWKDMPRARWAFGSVFGVFVLAAFYFTYLRIEPINLIRNYMGIVLSGESEIRKSHANVLSKDWSYAIELKLSRKDIDKFVKFFGDGENRMDGAIDRIPRSWPAPNAPLKRYILNRGSVWFYLDIIEATGEAWISIQTT